MSDFDKAFGVSRPSISNLLRDTAAFNRQMNDPEEWKKRRRVKLEEYELPKIEAEGRQNILRQEAANIPELRKLGWESSDRYFEKQEDLITTKNRPDMMTARTNAGYKDYLTSPQKHARDIENAMVEQIHYFRDQDVNQAATAAQAAAKAASNKEIYENPAYYGNKPTTGVARPPGTTAPNVSERQQGPSNPLSPTPFWTKGKDWTADHWAKPSPIWRKESWNLDMDAKPSGVATIPETSKIDPLAGSRSDQVISESMNPAAPSQPAPFYQKYFQNQAVPEQNPFERYGTAPTPGTYLDELNRKNRRRKGRELPED